MSDDKQMLQVHALTSYPASLLNRDDAGLAKRIRFGDTYRTRISSQCLKKHWRECPVMIPDDVTSAVRSRLTFERYVSKPLQEDHHLGSEEADGVASFLMATVLQAKDADASDSDEGDSDDDSSDDSEVRAKQVVVLSEPEARWLTDVALKIVELAKEKNVSLTDSKKLKKVLGTKDNKAFWKEQRELLSTLAASIDVALFGRFVTSDILARVDTSVSVSHAFTTHEELAETDYFTAVDMLDTSSSGAGHLNDTELTSGVFYTYVMVDLDQLRRNLGVAADRAEEHVAHLIRTVATVGPTAKRGSTAPYAVAEFVMIERGNDQPRTLANAFREAVPLESGEDPMQTSIRRLLAHRGSLARMHGIAPTYSIATIHEDCLPEGIGAADSLSSAVKSMLKVPA